MADRTIAIRETVVARMRASAGVTAIVPAESIYGERVPDQRTYPFIRTGEQMAESFPMATYDDGAYDISIHGFATSPDSGMAASIGGAIREEFNNDGATLVFDDGAVMVLVWQRSGIIKDPDEPDTWHSFTDYSAA